MLHYDGCARPDKRKITKQNPPDSGLIDKRDGWQNDNVKSRAAVLRRSVSPGPGIHVISRV
jgi:hypothetical protein